MMEIINHFIHDHPLKRYVEFERHGFSCNMCGQHLSEVRYKCDNLGCMVWLHKTCAEFPKQLRHPFHQGHTLTLRNISSKKDCSLCGDSIDRYGYHCSDCDQFSMDLPCAALTPYNNCRGPDPLINNCRDPDPLILCDKPQDYTYSCCFCGNPFENLQPVHVSLKWNRVVHKSCSSLPIKIKQPFQHPFHPEHSLTFLPSTERFRTCSICTENNLHASYYCEYWLCNFCVDLECAKLVPSSKDNDHSDHGFIEVQPTSHSHPLIQCDSIKNFKHKCSGCKLPIEDSIYVCRECPALLHESCANMPSEIIHPFHPKHSLNFLDGSQIPCNIDNTTIRCGACDDYYTHFGYFCLGPVGCNFYLDIRCATAKLSLIWTNNHPHALAYFNFKTKTSFYCHICHKHTCDQYFFRCVECNFNIHAYCYQSLPKTIKHDCHLHSLKLTTEHIKDAPDEDENAEFYCNACEERRDLKESTYYCATCHFVAHVHCLMSEILPILQKNPGSACKVDNPELYTTMRVVSRDKVMQEGDAEVTGTDMVGRTHTEATATTQEVDLHKLDADIARHEEEMDALTKEMDAIKKEIDELRAKLDGLGKRHHDQGECLRVKLLFRGEISRREEVLRSNHSQSREGQPKASSDSDSSEDDDRNALYINPDNLEMMKQFLQANPRFRRLLNLG